MSFKGLIRVAIVAAFFAAWSAKARAAFQLPTTNAQTTAMGGSSGASLQDSSAIFVNPAATSGLLHGEAYFGYNQLYAGLSGVGSIGQGLLTAGFPTPFGAISLGLADLKADSLLEERVIGLSYARRLGLVDAGVTAKYMYHRYLIGGDTTAQADPTFQNGTSRGAFSLDAGLVASLTETWKANLAVRHLNQPDVGLLVRDRVPREVQGGFSYEYAPWQLRATADVTYRASPSGDVHSKAIPAIGLEKRYQTLRLRAGATPSQFSAGVGIDWSNFGFDYAFVLTRGLMGENFGSHSIGIRYRFGTGKRVEATAATGPVAQPPETDATPPSHAASAKSAATSGEPANSWIE